jgi:hypothetical protein
MECIFFFLFITAVRNGAIISDWFLRRSTLTMYDYIRDERCYTPCLTATETFVGSSQMLLMLQ